MPSYFPPRRQTPVSEAQDQEALATQVMQQQADQQDFITKQRKEQERQQQVADAAAKEAARAQKADIARHKKAGALTETDAAGNESIKRHPDGVPMYEAGFQGEPTITDGKGTVKYRDARGQAYDVPFDAIRSEQDPAGQTFYAFDTQDETGKRQTFRQPAGTNPLFRIDKATGQRIADVTDPATGSVNPAIVGTDPAAASQAAIAKRKDALQLRQNELGGEADMLRLQQNAAETQFAPVKEKHDAAKAEFDKITKAKTQYAKTPEGLVAVTKMDDGTEFRTPVDSTNAQALSAANAWLEQKNRIQSDYEAAKAEHDPAKDALHQMQVKRDQLAISMLEEKRRANAEIQRMEEAAKRGERVDLPEWQKRALSLVKDRSAQDTAAVADLEDAAHPLAEDVKRVALPQSAKLITDVFNAGFNGPQDMTGTGPLRPGVTPSKDTLQQIDEARQRVKLTDVIANGMTAGKPATATDAKAAKDLASKSLGMNPDGVDVSEQKPEGHYELSRKGELFASFDPQRNRLTLLDTPTTLQDKGAEIIANASPDGVPVYMASAEQPYRPAEVRDLIKDGVNASLSAKTEDERDAALAAVGLDSAGIRQKVMAGKLSVQDGKMLNEKLNSVQQINTTSPAVQAEFGKWLATTPIMAEKFRQGSHEQKAEVVNQFMDGFAAKAAAGVVLDRSLLARRREELLAGTDDRGAISKGLAYTGGVLKNGSAFLAGIGYWVLRTPDRAVRLVGGTDDEATNLIWNQSRDLAQRLTGEAAPWNKDSSPMSRTLGDVQAWADRADSVDDLPDELANKLAEEAFTQYHGFSNESAADVDTTRDTFNVKTNPQLRPLLEQYLKTGNAAAFQSMFSMLKANARERDTQVAVQKYIERPRTATTADAIARANLLGIQLDATKAAAALNLAGQLENAKEPKQYQAVLKQAAGVLGLAKPEHAALALAEIARQETTDPDSWTGSFRGASVAGIEEVGTEVASDLALAALSATMVGAPEAVALKGAQVAAKQGIRASMKGAFTKLVTHNLDNLANRSTTFAKIREAIGTGRAALGRDLRQLDEDFANAGIYKAKFGAPLTTGQKAANFAVGTGKAMIAGAPVEAFEEGLTALLSNDPSAVNIGDSMLQGALGVGGITPAFAGVQGIRNAYAARGQLAQWEKIKGDYIAQINAVMGKEPGFKPLTTADFDAWQGLQESPEHRNAAADYAAARSDYNTLFDELSQVAAGNAPVAITPELIAAKARLEAATANLAGISQTAFAAMDELRDVPEGERVLYTAAAKAAAGATDYTEAEAKALMQQSGANAVVFQQAVPLPAGTQGPVQVENLADIPNVTQAAPGVIRLPEGVRLDVPQPLMDMLAAKAPSMVQLMGRGAAVPANQAPAGWQGMTKPGGQPSATPGQNAPAPAMSPAHQQAADELAAQAPAMKALPKVAKKRARLLATLKSKGVVVRVVNTTAEAEAILGKKVAKGRKGVAQDVNGVPHVVLIGEQSETAMADTLDHEAIHGLSLTFAAENPELHAAAMLAVDPASPEFDAALNEFMRREYNGYDKLSTRQKFEEALRAIVEGRWKGRTSAKSKGFKKFLKAFLAYVRGLLDSSQNAALKQIVAHIELALSAQESSPSPAPATGTLELKTWEQYGAVEVLPDGRIRVTAASAEKANALEAELQRQGINWDARGQSSNGKGENLFSLTFQPKAQTPAPKAQTPAKQLPAKQLEQIAREAIARVLARGERKGTANKLKAIVKESDKPSKTPTGGMWMNAKTGVIHYHVPTIVAQLAQVPDTATVGKRVMFLLDEEIRHAANYEAAKRLFAKQKAKNPMMANQSFEEWRDMWYTDLWKNHFTDAMRQKVETERMRLIGFREADWQLAFEGLRMLDQLRATGSITEQVLEALVELMQALRDFYALVAEGSKEAVAKEIEGIRSVLAEYGYEGGTVKPEKAKKKPAKAKVKQETSKPADSAPEMSTSGPNVTNAAQVAGFIESAFAHYKEKNSADVTPGGLAVPDGSVVYLARVPWKVAEADMRKRGIWINDLTAAGYAAEPFENDNGTVTHLHVWRVEQPSPEAAPESARPVPDASTGAVDGSTTELPPVQKAPPGSPELAKPTIAPDKHWLFDTQAGDVAGMTEGRNVFIVAHFAKLKDAKDALAKINQGKDGPARIEAWLAKPKKEGGKVVSKWAVFIPNVTQDFVDEFNAIKAKDQAAATPVVSQESPLREQQASQPQSGASSASIDKLKSAFDGLGSAPAAESTHLAAAPARSAAIMAALPDAVRTRILEAGHGTSQQVLSREQAEGLASAPAAQQIGLPKERRAAFLDVAESLISDGVNTPKALARALNEARPDGSLRKYSQALWNFFGTIDPALTGQHDWQAVYAELDQVSARPPSAEGVTGPSSEQGAAPAAPPTSFPVSVARALMAMPYHSRTFPMGDRNAELRQQVLEVITGERPPKSKAGANAVREALRRFFNVSEDDTTAAIDENIQKALQAVIDAADPAPGKATDENSVIANALSAHFGQKVAVTKILPGLFKVGNLLYGLYNVSKLSEQQAMNGIPVGNDQMLVREEEETETASTESVLDKAKTEVPERGDTVTWTDGAGKEAVSMIDQITNNADGTPVAWVEWFGVKSIPLDQLTLKTKSSQRLNRERREAEAAAKAGIPTKEVTTPEPVKEKKPADNKALKEMKRFLLEKLDDAIAEAPDFDSGDNISAQMTALEGHREFLRQLLRNAEAYTPVGIAKIKDRLGALIQLPEKAGFAEYDKALGQLINQEAARIRALRPKVIIEIPGDGTFTLLNDKKTLKEFAKIAKGFPTTTPSATYPKPTAIRSSSIPALNKAKLSKMDMVKVAGTFASTDETRMNIMQVVDVGDTLVATNGKYLFMAPFEGQGTAEDPMLYTAKGGQIGPQSKHEEDFGKYPDWKVVVPKDTQVLHTGIDTGRLWQILKQASAVFRDVNFQVKNGSGTFDDAAPYVDLLLNPDGSVAVVGEVSNDSGAASNLDRYEHNLQEGAQSIGRFDASLFMDILAAMRALGQEKVSFRSEADMSQGALVVSSPVADVILMRVRTQAATNAANEAAQEAMTPAEETTIARDSSNDAPAAPKASGLRTQADTIHAGRSPAELLALAAPYEQQGPDYNRNIAESAARLRQSVERGDKSVQYNADELAVRLEKWAPEASLNRMEQADMRRFSSDLNDMGVAYVNGDRYAIKQANDGTYYVERTRKGQREELATGFADIAAANRGALEIVSGASTTAPSIIPPTPAQERILAQLPTAEANEAQKKGLGFDRPQTTSHRLPNDPVIYMDRQGEKRLGYIDTDGKPHMLSVEESDAKRQQIAEFEAQQKQQLEQRLNAMRENARAQDEKRLFQPTPSGPAYYRKGGQWFEHGTDRLLGRKKGDDRVLLTLDGPNVNLYEVRIVSDNGAMHFAPVSNDTKTVSPETPAAELPDTAVQTTDDAQTFTQEQAVAELAKRGITLEQESTKTGKTVWRIKGKTFDVKDTLKALGAKWYNPAKAWSLFSNENPAQKIASALAGTSPPPTSGSSSENNAPSGGNADEDLRLKQLRERLDGTPDRRGARGDAVASVNADTAALIRRGLKFGMPADVVEDQIEDIATITAAFEAEKPMFLLGNGAGTGKTFVLGGAIRELRSKGAGPFVYVTMNQDLIEQIKKDLADYGVSDVRFHTYSEASTKGIDVPKGAVLIFDEAHNVKNADSERGSKGQSMMGNAKFTIFASATPFENPVQAGYLAGTGIFNDVGGHVEWGKAYGAGVRKWKEMTPYGMVEKEALIWNGGKLEDGLAARQWFVRQGIMVTRPMRLPMEMVESQFSKKPVEQKWVDMHDRVNAAYDEAMQMFRDEDGNILDAKNNSQVAMHQVNTVKRILESAKVDHAIAEAQRILASGGNVVVFVETKADRWIGRYRASQFYEKNGPLYTYPQMRSMMDQWSAAANMARAMNERTPPRPFSEAIMSIARSMHNAGIEYELPSVEQEIVERLGGKDAVAVYTGSVANTAAFKDKEAFLAGKKKVIVATMAKGGTGLSLHDKVGNRPTFQLNINLPWVATGVDQVSGRVARYGLQSKAHINWLFAENIAFERMLANRVGRRMRDMGALVKGIDMKAARVLTEGFDFDSVADVKQDGGEVTAPEEDMFAVAERLERTRRQKGDQSAGFFETPFPLAALMTQMSGARGRMLEPSAGRGNLLRFAKDKAASVLAVELRPDNADYLRGQGINVENADFADWDASGQTFDTIHMNPPFERKAGFGWQDMAHLRKAHSLLAPGGRLVAIIGEGGFFRSDNQSREFREWLDENGAYVVKLPEGAFKNSNTNVRTRMIVMDQGAESGRTDLDLSDMDADSLRDIADAIPSREADAAAAESITSTPEPVEATAVSTPAKNADDVRDVMQEFRDGITQDDNSMSATFKTVEGFTSFQTVTRSTTESQLNDRLEVVYSKLGRSNDITEQARLFVDEWRKWKMPSAKVQPPRATLGRSKIGPFEGFYYDDVFADLTGQRWILRGGNAWTLYREKADGQADYSQPHPRLANIESANELRAIINRMADETTEAPTPEPTAQPAAEVVTTPPAEEQPAPQVPPAKRAKKSAAKIEDFGEKIGGARKDTWKERGLGVADFDNLSDTEKQAYTVKPQVFPKPDYQAWIDGGMPRELAYALKEVYDAITPKPNLTRAQQADPVQRDAALRLYVEFVSRIRDALPKITNLDELKALRGQLLPSDGRGMTQPEARAALELASKTRGNRYTLGGKMTPSSYDLYQYKQELEQNTAWPASQEAWQRMYSIRKVPVGTVTSTRLPDGTYERKTITAETPDNWQVIKSDGRWNVIVSDGHATREEAEAVAKRLAEAKKGDKGGPLKRPLNPDARRVGPDYRNGRDVTGQDLLDTFGFRGGEFGNWTNEADRQQSLNQAYDGLLDLARVLNLPPKALSLNGELGIAFGARGSGKASAHYEPAKVVINLTRTSGAGALAHEWAHAVDDYFGRMVTKGQIGKYVSHGVKGSADFRAELAEAINAVMKAIDSRQTTAPEYIESLKTRNAEAKKALESWLKSVERVTAKLQLSQDSKNAVLELQETLLGNKLPQIGEGGRPNMTAVANEMLTIYALQAKAQKEHISWPVTGGGKMSDLASGLGRHAGAIHFTNSELAKAEAGTIEIPTRMVETSFLKESKEQGDYWQRRHELFARAFEAFVEDSIRLEGNASPYLVQSTFDSGAWGSLYPQGDERTATNEALRKMAATFKTRDTEKGVALFSAPVRSTMPRDRAEAIVRNLTPKERAGKLNPKEREALAEARSVVDGVSLASAPAAMPLTDVVAKIENLYSDPSDPDNWPEDVMERYQTSPLAEAIDEGDFIAAWKAAPAEVKDAKVSRDLANLTAAYEAQAKASAIQDRVWFAPFDTVLSPAQIAEIKAQSTQEDARVKTALFRQQVAEERTAAELTDAEQEAAAYDTAVADEWLNSDELADAAKAPFMAEAKQRAQAAIRHIEATGRYKWDKASETFDEVTNDDVNVLYSAPARIASHNDALARAAATLRGEGQPIAAGLRSMFNPQSKRPATGERGLFDMPKQLTSAVSLANIAKAYRAVQSGTSSAFVPIRAVFERMKAAHPSMTPEDFMAEIRAADERGDIMVEAPERPETIQQAGPFVVRNALGVPSTNMMVVDQGGDVLASAPASPFYSKLSRVITEKMPNRADVATIKGLITNPQTGIKAEELKWSGILPWLEGQTTPITKQAVLDYLATDGAVRLEEVWLGDDLSKAEDERWMELQIRLNNDETLSEAEQREYDALDNRTGTGVPKFAQYQLPGGENYRELVLALPKAQSTTSWRIDPLPEGGFRVLENDREITRRDGKPMRYQTRTGALSAVDLLRQNQQLQSYTSSHFSDVQNYVAHMRLNDREDAEGKPGTFIEEIQSDRHQAGREKGYQNDQIRMPNDELPEGYEVRQGETGKFEVWGPSGYVSGTYAATRAESIAKAQARIEEGYNAKIPDAPFRKDWPLQMFKRALAEAVAAGKQWIGWTTGDTQAERYDLSKQLSRISYEPNENGTFDFEAYPLNDDLNPVISESDIDLKRIEELAGKEVAKKVEAREGDKDKDGYRDWHHLRGLNLRVGGEGMKGFYDTILPKEIGRYVKQWGAGVVKGSVKTPGTNIQATGRLVGIRNDDGTERWNIVDERGRVMVGPFADDTSAEAEQTRMAEGSAPIWRVDITPQMRSGVESGQALFSAPAPKQDKVREILESMPPIWRDVLQDQWNGKSIEDIAGARNLSLNAVGNILRMAGGRFQILMDKAATKPTVQVEDGTVKATHGRPDLAMSGNAAFAGIDQRRQRPEEVTHAEMQELASRMFAADAEAAEKLIVRWMDSGTTVLSTDGMPDAIKAIVNDAQARSAAEMLMTAAAKMLVTKKALAGGNTTQIARLIDLYRNTGTEQARALGMRQDPFDTPEERAAMYLQEALLTPPESLRNEIRRNPANKERILAAWAAKADKIKAELLAHGIDLDATFREMAKEKELAEATIPEPVKPVLARAPKKTRQLVKALLQGLKPSEAIAAAGMTAKAAFAAYKAFRESINQAGADAAKAMQDQLLRSAPAGDFASNLGLPDLTEEQWMEAIKADKPLRTTPETDKLKEQRERKKAGGEIDLKNPLSTNKARRAIEERKSNTFDKMSEFWRASILSGPQTHVVNIVSGLTYGAYESSFKKLAAGAQADIARMFGMKPDAASLADIPAMIAAALPAIKAAFLDSIAAWKSETRLFDSYALQLTDDNGALFKESFSPALKGALGKIMRGMSFRLMGAADEFVKSFFTRIEVAAQARQIARNEGKTGADMANAIAELMEPGSLAWERALAQAKKITFQTEIGSGIAAVDTIDGLASLITRTKKGDFGKALKGLAHFTFPFVDTPTNIFKQGITMSPVGGLLAIIDLARSLHRRTKGNTADAERLYNAARGLDDLTNQIVAWGFILGLSQLVKPGDDDEELPYITGTIPWRSTSPGEREIAYRTAPPQSIRIGGQWYSYKRLDPFASALAFTVDAIKEMQSGKPLDEAWGNIGLGMMRNMQDKTFLQGVSDLVNAVQDPERFGTKWATNIAIGFIPNLIRQPIRTGDDLFRENDLPNDMGFWEALGRRVGFGMYPKGWTGGALPDNPVAPMPAYDIWGREAAKNTGTGQPATDWALRLLSPVDTRDADNVDKLDLALLRYNMRHDEPFGVAAPSREIQRTIAGKVYKISLNDAEYTDFARKSGQASRAAIGDRYNGRDLTEADVKNIKNLILDVHDRFRELAFTRAVQARGGLNMLANTTK